jgi:hypothetical protein
MTDPSHLLAAIEAQIERKSNPRTSYVDAYLVCHRDEFPVTPVIQFDEVVPHRISRGDFWATMEVPDVEWSHEQLDYRVPSVERYLTVETELDVRFAIQHGHSFSTAGEYHESDISEIDMVIAAEDNYGDADKIRRHHGIPVFVIEEMTEVQPFDEFKSEEPWKK